METGQIAYESFHHVLKDLGWVHWRDLSPQEQEAWRVAAHEVMQRGWWADVQRLRRHRG